MAYLEAGCCRRRADGGPGVGAGAGRRRADPGDRAGPRRAGVRRYSVAAGTRRPAGWSGWSLLSLAANTTRHAWQQITIVDPAHRGHRLGLLCKAENLAHTLAYEPELQVIDTYNAAANSHMIAINEQLGFRPAAGSTEWQLTI